MRLLIITQKMDKNDPILGFFHGWVNEFAKHFESIVVICLEKGEYDLPSNVKVLSLGKESSKYRLKFINRLYFIVRFYRYIWQERNHYDAVFVHMNQEYVLLGGLIWRLWGKKVGLWYVHRRVSLSLRLAVLFVNHVFTSAKESFGIQSKKVNYVGHGIDISYFQGLSNKKIDFVAPDGGNDGDSNQKIIKIMHVGRITPLKHCEVLIKAISVLRDEHNIEAQAKFIGASIYKADEEYLASLRRMIEKEGIEDRVFFVGGVPNRDINKYIEESDISVNMCPTGGMDKAVIESMASGLPVFVSNSIFVNVFGEYAEDFIFEFGNPQSLVQKVVKFLKRSDIDYIRNKMKEKSKEFDIGKLIEKISNKYKV